MARMMQWTGAMMLLGVLLIIVPAGGEDGQASGPSSAGESPETAVGSIVNEPVADEAAADESAADDDAEQAVGAEDEPDGDEPPQPLTREQQLWKEIELLHEELRDLRARFAGADLRAAEAERELSELKQFMRDHDRYGDAYEHFQQFQRMKERERRAIETERRREQYEEFLAERRQRYERARAFRAVRLAERREQRRFEDAGFTPLGLDVYLGQSSYIYQRRDALRTRVRYSPLIGRYLRPELDRDVDFTEMIVSGSVVSAASDVRNVGVALAFFDERGNQVGHEIVQVNNARPNVPYPFTSTIRMALDRPFSSSTAYVLYADPVPTNQPQWRLLEE